MVGSGTSVPLRAGRVAVASVLSELNGAPHPLDCGVLLGGAAAQALVPEKLNF